MSTITIEDETYRLVGFLDENLEETDDHTKALHVVAYHPDRGYFMFTVDEHGVQKGSVH